MLNQPNPKKSRPKSDFLTSDPLPGHPDGKGLCEIFGHYPWQAITADLPENAAAAPLWRTLTGYPLRPRVLWSLWQDANTLIGVRFGQTTRYALIDLDAGSPYRSNNGGKDQSAESIATLRAALETIGIARTLLIRSSWNGGLHLYVPLPEAVNTFNLAVALEGCLKAQGFEIKPGQLEIFPNPKTYGVTIFVEYNAHRLPLQPGSGSCVLDDALQPVTDSLSHFLWIWEQAAEAQDMEMLHRALSVGRNNRRRRARRTLSLTQTWRADLEIEIAEGWTDYGQTNRLLKTIACYGVVFERHQGTALIDYICRIAPHLPGYRQYCRHQGEIRRRAIAWARAAEKYYWPMGSPTSTESTPNQNEVRSQDARCRIQRAAQQLLTLGQMPTTVRARVQVLITMAQTSAQTLYKHLGLWHPDHLSASIAEDSKPFLAQQPEQSPVTADPERDQKDAASFKAGFNDRSNLEKTGALQTLERLMKGESSAGHDAGSNLNLISPERGVRGETLSFPQPDQAIEMEGLGPTSGSQIPLSELFDKLADQVKRLGWTAEQIMHFIAARFEGRRRSQLQDEELITLLYYLRQAYWQGAYS
ncbi:hypothetical protein [Pseudanabaena sp. FACHB-2040]|uniref:hypothetical protein n=1 Tax=Pseudanabaena sp. FACHB-2040 TaxID=2692859 RepID=UPI0016865043|nr:hypothetical protein [Pseudanabaena sp. FACHB-2040]MBD2258324.1 hypothetical protein [Pseudanabaena sp. FACHB-2040]